MIWFGPAGNSDSFYEEGYKDPLICPCGLKTWVLMLMNTSVIKA